MSERTLAQQLYHDSQLGLTLAELCEKHQLKGEVVAEILNRHERERDPLRRGNIANIVSPDAETQVNAAGGKQSHIPVRFDLIDAKALFKQAAVLHEGAEKYGEDNWRLIPVEDHLNHLITHAYAYLSGDRTDEHLSHIMCRATFAQAVDITDNE